MPPHFGSCRSGYHLFKVIRRFLFGTSPFFLQSSTAHLSAACGFSENSTTRFPFLFLSGATPLFLLLSTAPFLFFFGNPPTFPENGELAGRIDSLVLGERDSRRRAP